MTNLSYNDIELRGRDETVELNVQHIFIYYYEKLQSSGAPSEARMHDAGRRVRFLLSNLSLLGKQETKQVESKPKNLVYGIQGIADTFGCSIPTANRIKRSGVIDDAITRGA